MTLLGSCWSDTVRVKDPSAPGTHYVGWSAEILSRADSGYLVPRIKVTVRREASLEIVRYVTELWYNYGYDYHREVTIDLDEQQLRVLNRGAAVELVFEFEKTLVVHPTEDPSHLLPIAEDEEVVSGQNKEIWYRRPARGGTK
jgi:hypothetical protein